MDNLAPSTSFAALQASQQASQGALPKAAANLQAAKNARQLEKIEAAAQEFEAVFMAEMLKPMFEGIEVSEEFGGGKGEEIFNGFMIQEYGKILAKTGNIGIADQVKAEMIKRQGLETEAESKEIKTAQQNAAANDTSQAFNAIINDLTKDGD